jgi:crotonobetainyl-CoA:carnitine CoA-transferase CaiB-like acyl-CoA transferase
MKWTQILDLTSSYAGPWAVQKLIQTSSTKRCIKLENLAHPDGWKFFPPLNSQTGLSLYYEYLNKNKKIINVNYNQIDTYLKNSDVVCFSMIPSVLRKFKLLPQQIKSRGINTPILAYLTGEGLASGRKMQDNGAVARSGYFSGFPEFPKYMPPLPLADIVAGNELIIKILMAKPGDIIDVSMVRSLKKELWCRFDIEKNKKYHSLNGEIPAYSIYRTKDGGIALGSITPDNWKKVSQILELSSEMVASGFSTGEEAKQMRHSLSEIFKTKTNKQWKVIFEARNCCVEVFSC